MRLCKKSFAEGYLKCPRTLDARLGRPLQLEELAAALSGMQGRKAPGIDGLTVEFYKEYWNILGPDLLKVLNGSLANGSLPLSCRRAIVALLP